MMKITSSKKQITNKFQKQNIETKKKFNILNFKYRELFEIYRLKFGFYFSTRKFRISRLASIVLLLPILLLTGCSYSFTGASVPPHLHTIAIPNAVDRSGSGEPALRDDFTNELIQKFIDDNSLQVTNKTSADAILNCTIISLPDAPVVIAGGEDVTKRRVTIKVKAVYKDLVKRKTVWDKTFSNYGDYENKDDITSARQAAIKTAIDRVTEDILLGVVSNW